MRLDDGSYYFDCNATIPMKRKAVKAFMDGEKMAFANPSSPYFAGIKSKEVLESSRANILRKLRFEGELVFTSSATEANNLVILSAAKNEKIKEIIISKIEHPSVYELRQIVKSFGKEIIEIGVDKDGVVDLEQLESAISSQSFVSILTVHNETGVIQPVGEIARICERKMALFHTDAVQGFGKIELPFGETNPNAITISSHKIGGPKGVGALAFDKKIELIPMICGGGQEKGLRSSTESIPLIFSFSCAVDLIDTYRFSKLKEIRDEMEDNLSQKFGLTIYGKNSERLPNTSFFSIRGLDGREAQRILNENKIYVGTGSACHGAGKNLPKVLTEMGFSNEKYPIRVSISSLTKKRDIEKFTDIFCSLF